MKKSQVIVCIILCFIFGCSGCKQDSNKQKDKITQEQITKATKEQQDDTINFWKNNNKISVKIEYQCTDTVEYIKKNGIVKIDEVQRGADKVYCMTVTSDDKSIYNETVGFFLLDEDKIYILENYNRLLELKKKNMQVVYQKQDIKQEMKDDGYGYTIENKSSKVRYAFHSGLVETSFYKVIEWSPKKEMLLYETGYGAGRDLFKIEFCN